MKKFLIMFLLSFFLFSCGRDKSEEISIKRQENTQKQKFVEEDPVPVPEEEEITKNDEGRIDIINTKKVSDYINKNAIVEGYVADVVIRPKVNYLNFDNKFPKQSFTAVIFPKDAEKFDDLNTYKNKNARVKGKVHLYKGKPQIIVNSPEQIQIIK